MFALRAMTLPPITAPKCPPPAWGALRLECEPTVTRRTGGGPLDDPARRAEHLLQVGQRDHRSSALTATKWLRRNISPSWSKSGQVRPSSNPIKSIFRSTSGEFGRARRGVAPDSGRVWSTLPSSLAVLGLDRSKFGRARAKFGFRPMSIEVRPNFRQGRGPKSGDGEFLENLLRNWHTHTHTLKSQIGASLSPPRATFRENTELRRANSRTRREISRPWHPECRVQI